MSVRLRLVVCLLVVCLLVVCWLVACVDRLCFGLCVVTVGAYWRFSIVGCFRGAVLSFIWYNI